MSQTRLGSLVEANVNMISGFAISMALWQFVLAPHFGYEVTLADNFQLTLIFTLVSILRSYLWRRFFNWLHHHHHQGNT